MKMKSKMGSGLFVAILVLFLVFSATSSLALGLSKKALARSHSGGMVDIRVTYLNPLGDIPAGELAFEVRINTHSVDLDGYSLDKLSTLTDNSGNVLTPLGWHAPGGGGHHRFGILKFKSTGIKNAKSITLTIKDIAGVKERSFTWELPIQ